VAERKTVTRQTMIGEAGIALISMRCLEMGFIFHPRRVDHGIDGHIDLVAPETGALLNQVLLVQSKAQDRRFPFEDEYSFRYLCDQRDLDLWLSGNAPVILVLSHPKQGEAWWADVKAAFLDVESRASRTIFVRKQTSRFDAAAASNLLRLGVPAASGLYLKPPPVTEILTTNLLPVVSMPPVIHLAPAIVTNYAQAREVLAGQKGPEPGWMLRDGLVMSFASLREPPLRTLCADDPEEHPTAEWADSEDAGTQHRFTDLLARTVERAYPDLRWHDSRHHVHFRASSDLKPRKAGKRPGTRGRTVFGPHYAKSDPGRVSFYHHAALKTRYRKIGQIWFCQLEPDYCFTADGHCESPFADSLLAGIKRLDRHPAVLGWTRMWATHLAAQPDLFSTEPPVVFGSLETVTVHSGIDDNWWGPAPAAAMTAEEPRHHATADAAAAADLVTHDIDTDDFFALITEAEPEPQPDAVQHHARPAAGQPGQRRQRRTGGRARDAR
jgi:hypothetical protein